MYPMRDYVTCVEACAQPKIHNNLVGTERKYIELLWARVRRTEKMSVTTEMNDLKFAPAAANDASTFVTLYLTNQTFNL